jgi:hypothetical protein
VDRQRQELRRMHSQPAHAIHLRRHSTGEPSESTMVAPPPPHLAIAGSPRGPPNGSMPGGNAPTLGRKGATTPPLWHRGNQPERPPSAAAKGNRSPSESSVTTTASSAIATATRRTMQQQHVAVNARHRQQDRRDAARQPPTAAGDEVDELERLERESSGYVDTFDDSRLVRSPLD